MKNYATLICVITTIVVMVTNIVKEELKERKKKYSPNFIATATALIVSVTSVILAYKGESIDHIHDMITLWLGSSLCSMVGYDKGMQLITQLVDMMTDKEGKE